MKRRVEATLPIVLWALCTYEGYSLVSGVAQRHQAGYPNATQWGYYVCVPLVMSVLSLGILLLAQKLTRRVFALVWALQIAALIPFLFAYGGGM
jgi:hypothetical protein